MCYDVDIVLCRCALQTDVEQDLQSNQWQEVPQATSQAFNATIFTVCFSQKSALKKHRRAPRPIAPTLPGPSNTKQTKRCRNRWNTHLELRPTSFMELSEMSVARRISPHTDSKPQVEGENLTTIPMTSNEPTSFSCSCYGLLYGNFTIVLFTLHVEYERVSIQHVCLP